MQNERRTPETLYHEIADYLITGFNTGGVQSENIATQKNGSRYSDLKTISGTVAYDFSAEFVLQYQATENRLTLLMTSHDKANGSTATIVYSMPNENTVEISESWNGKECDAVKSLDNRDFMSNVSIGMSYVHFILAFIENLA